MSRTTCCRRFMSCRPRSLLTLLAFLGLVSPVVPAAQVPPDFDREVRRTELELGVAGMLIRSAEKEGIQIPTPDDPVVPLHALRWQLPEPYAAMLPTRDVWGNAYLWIQGKQSLLVSPGIDGILDFPYEDGQEGRNDFLRMFVDDVVVDEYTVLSAPRLVRWIQTRTMAEIRSIGTAAEVFAVDRNAYPGPTEEFVGVEWLVPDLSPVFIKELPLQDGWGNPILFWSDGAGYLLISLGADGEPDEDYGTLRDPLGELSTAGGTAHPDRDIVYSNGGFLQWPESLQR